MSADVARLLAELARVCEVVPEGRPRLLWLVVVVGAGKDGRTMFVAADRATWRLLGACGLGIECRVGMNYLMEESRKLY